MILVTRDTTPIEAAILGHILEARTLPASGSIHELIKFAPESFVDAQLRIVALAVKQLMGAGKPTAFGEVSAAVGDQVNSARLFEILAGAYPAEIAEHEATSLFKAFLSRQRRRTLEEGLRDIDHYPEQSATVSAVVVRALQFCQGADNERDAQLKRLAERRFDPNIEPPPFRPLYFLAGVPIATRGNLQVISAQAKAGKSAFLGALIAASIAQDRVNTDYLGVHANFNAGGAIVHFDTEQSPDDHWHAVTRATKRARVDTVPTFLHSYRLTGLGVAECLEMVRAGLRYAVEQHGSIFSILIDGVADLVADINDSAECNALVSTLHALAIEFDAPIVCVIHLNPGSTKTRGHLGSQLERKAETNLVLEKVDDVVEVYSTKQRRAPIPKGTGPRFVWSDDAGMHVSCGDARKPSKQMQRIQTHIDECFAEGTPMTYTELIATLEKAARVSPKTAETWVRKALEEKLIRKNIRNLYTTTHCEQLPSNP